MFDDVLYRIFLNTRGITYPKNTVSPSSYEKKYYTEYIRAHGEVTKNKTYNFRVPEALFSKFTETLTEYIQNCITCLQSKPLPTASLKPPLQPLSSKQNFPADVMLIDLVGKMHPSPYTFILSGIGVFSKYLFAVPLTKGDTAFVARALTS